MRGLTALMKAAVQGQKECVTALLLAGALLSRVSQGIAGQGPSLGGKFFDSFENPSKDEAIVTLTCYSSAPCVGVTLAG